MPAGYITGNDLPNIAPILGEPSPIPIAPVAPAAYVPSVVAEAEEPVAEVKAAVEPAGNSILP